MAPTDLSEGPPFPTVPGDVSGAGLSVLRSGGMVTGVGTSLRTAHEPAWQNVDGVIEEPMVDVLKLPFDDLDLTSKTARVAAGALGLYDGARVAYNGTINELNSEWKSYSDRAYLPGGATKAQAEAFQAAIDEKKSDLRRRQSTAEGTFDDAATDAIGLLDLGPAALDNPRLKSMVDRGLKTYFVPKAGMTSAELKALLDDARASGLDPKDYKDLLQQYYVTKAAEKAGIDMSDWDPSKGAEGLRDIIEKVYTYYGQLYLDNPNLKWAGMANMIGPSFAAGFFDLNLFRNIADKAAGPLDDLPDEVRDSLPHPISDIGKLSDLTQEDLNFYETTFLQMQKDIFIDQAAMHEAYLEGGVDAIEEMRDAGLFDNGDPDQTVESWQQIDGGITTGDNDLINQGNKGLLYREQHDIIDDAYQQMYDHDPTGPVVTYLMGVVGDPSIPDAQTLGEVDPLTFTGGADPWGPGKIDVTVETPLPAGNIADFDTRWNLIEEDTLDKYLAVVDGDPDRAEEIIGSSVHDRIEEDRIYWRIDDIVDDFKYNWDIDIDVGW